MPEEHAGTRIDDRACEPVEQRPNDINANGDRPTRETPATMRDILKTAGGHFRETLIANMTASPLEGAR